MGVQKKYDADGILERYKACVVAKGFNQQPGQDYFETFASTMRQATVHIVLKLDYVICHMVSRLTNLVMSWSQG